MPGSDTDIAGGDIMQGIDKEIAENYGFNVTNIVQYKDSYMIVSPMGKKLLKRIPFSQDRLMFVHAAKEHLAANGFTHTDRYLTTLSGEPGFYSGGNLFAVTDFIEGRESSFDSDADIRRVSAVLAELHRASAGYDPPEECKVRSELGKLPGYFSKRIEDIKKMKRQAAKEQGRFDQLFLKYADYYINLAQTAAEQLASSAYETLTEKAARERSFCHHDYTHHNIIINDGTVAVTNFDYCCFDLRVYDIANLIRRKMRKSGWDVSKASLILESYSKTVHLDYEELELMKIMLIFPQKFWRVVNRYYNSRRSWSEKIFIGRLQEVIDEIAPFDAFIKAYDAEIL